MTMIFVSAFHFRDELRILFMMKFACRFDSSHSIAISPENCAAVNCSNNLIMMAAGLCFMTVSALTNQSRSFCSAMCHNIRYHSSATALAFCQSYHDVMNCLLLKPERRLVVIL
jgi:hypothetical protein